MTVNQNLFKFSTAALLEKVDKLRDLNIGQHVPLPQVSHISISTAVSRYLI